MTLAHHDLCFGCGVANVFGLQMEVEHVREGIVQGRFFLKQDHQGRPGEAHPGVMAAALEEALALLAEAEGNVGFRVARLELEVRETAPVGSFVEVEARLVDRGAVRMRARAVARGEDRRELAEARATLLAARG